MHSFHRISTLLLSILIGIQAFAFEDCTSLVQVKAGNTLKKIKKSAFSGCTALKYINLPNPGLFSIGN